jgi:transposase
MRLMYIKITKSKNFKYVRVVRSFRENGKIRHEEFLNLGRLDLLENNPSWKKIISKLATIVGIETKNLDSCSEASILNWGYVVYKKLWNKFKLNEILAALQSSCGKTKFNLSNACFLMTIQHLLSPTSKLGSYQNQQRYANLPEVGFNHLYRSLDILCEGKAAIESHLFQMNRDLFNMKIDVVFYDVTTFHFESVQQDDLKDFGFSKNAKFNEVQVVLGMLVDCEGRPVGYELFPGNTFEGKTLEKALDSIDKRFGIRNVIIVADRGINSKLNLKQIVDKGYGYILASRIKSMPEKVQTEIFKQEDYVTLSQNETDGIVKCKVIDYVNEFKIKDENRSDNVKRKKQIVVELQEKLIVTYSDKRARKDKADRERLLEKASYLLQDKSRIQSSNKRGGKKYLKEMTKTDWKLDIESIERDEKWDGYYGIQTSEKELSVSKILEAHHTLWRIEESFKIMKSTLEVRPIFHWTEKRIKGHFVVCFLAFLLERTLEIKLKDAEIQASPNSIREALNSMQLAELELHNEKVFVKTKSEGLGPKILRCMRIQPLKNIIPANELKI